MTAEEYYNLPHFNKEDFTNAYDNAFRENTIFEVHTLHKTITYVKVIKNFFNSYVRLHECNQQGELIPNPLGRFEAKIAEIKLLIDEQRFWRFYKLEQVISDEVPDNNNRKKVILSLQPDEFFHTPDKSAGR